MPQERRPHPALRGQQTAHSGAARRPRASRTPAPSATRPPAGRTLRRPASGTSARRPRPGWIGTALRSRPKKSQAPKAPLRIPLANGPQRLRVVLVALAICLSLCAGRLLQLQGFDSSAYAATSSEQLTRTLPLLPSRGDITDRNGLVLATTEAAVAVTADPALTRPKAREISAVLTAHLGIDQYELYLLLTKPKTRFVYLAKKVPALTYSKIAADLTSKKLYGVFRESDPIRTYPGRTVGATVVGYVNGDGKGMAGLERSMNAELAGVEGKEVYESAPNGSRIPLGTSRITPAVNGVNYQLTSDSELQWVAERRLAAQVAERKADSGFAITMDITTGEVLALANVPTYDSGRPGAADANNLINRAVSNPYEPGSVQKVLTAAALLDSRTTTPETRVLIPPRLPSGGHSIKDAFRHDTLKFLMRGVIAKSSNIGTILMARQMRAEQLRDYLASFGLGSRTGIELPGESSGILPPGSMPGYTRDQIAFGQAVSVTGVQQAAAIAGLVNGGQYHPPTVIKGATDSAGQTVPVERRAPRQVISPEASAGVRNLMRAVVDNSKAGTGVGLPNYHTGGKTGTAQRSEQSCRCYQGYVTSYVGFAPLNNPRILTYVVINNPREGQQSGTSSAAPVYKDIMNFALPRYGIAPTTKKLKPQPIAYGAKKK